MGPFGFRPVPFADYSRRFDSVNCDIADRNGKLVWDAEQFDRSLRVREVEALERQASAAARQAKSLETVEVMLSSIHDRLGLLTDPVEADRVKKKRSRLARNRLREESRERAEAVYRRAKVSATVGDLNLADLDVPVRARKGFLREGIGTVAELLAKTEDELLDIRNFGHTSLTAVKRALAFHGLFLATDDGEADLTTVHPPATATTPAQ